MRACRVLTSFLSFSISPVMLMHSVTIAPTKTQSMNLTPSTYAAEFEDGTR